MIYLVEDDPSLLPAYTDFLRARGLHVEGFEAAEPALAAARSSPPDVLVTDIQLPGMSGVELTEKMAEVDPSVVRVVMTAHADVHTAVRAMRSGAYEYLEKPVDLPRLARLLERALDERRSRLELNWHRERKGPSRLLGDSPAARRLAAEIERAGSLPRPAPPVLLTGETGVGKSLVARLIHEAAGDDDAPWIAVNCAALPASLIEAELFGYERAAFTDAKSAKPGLVEAAHKGTLFLDEIGEMPPEAQAKLLGVVESGLVRRVGAIRDRSVEVSIIAATNVDLEAAVADGRFRADLFHRLAAFRIEPPPLRERGEDVLVLARAFLAKARARYRRPQVEGLSRDAERALAAHTWPGNVRELHFAVERAVLAVPAGGGEIEAEHLSLSPQGQGPAPSSDGASIRVHAGEVSVQLPEEGIDFERIERAVLEAMLRQTGGNVAQAAQRLGFKRDAMRYRIKRLKLDPRRFSLGS